VAGKAVLRRLIVAGTRIVQMGYASEGEVSQLVDAARAEVDEVPGARRQAVRLMSSTVLDTIAGLDEPVAQVPSPWRALNGCIGGFRPGSLYVLGARPGVGKTALALQIGLELAKVGTVAFCSLEMPERELHLRAIA